MPPKASRSSGRTRRTGRSEPPGPDPLDLAERLFGPDPGQESRLRGDDADEALGVHAEPLWVRLLGFGGARARPRVRDQSDQAEPSVSPRWIGGFELPWRRRKRR